MAHPDDKFANRQKDRIDAARGATQASPEELHDELVEGAPGSDYDRSLTRENDFGGGFGQGHYTGTSWDPEIRETPDKARRETDEEGIERPREHRENASGSACAGTFGGVQSAGLTTGGSSRHSS